ncbi:AraC family transcriptional regulator [Yoonia sp. F2084L]|uniref:AraC family transcriptional regulator n=1 Tax=Yoonia sp. F2084L TaxID=2926419 RepID=UPI001FF44445|nr:AraC family transcriptional regulator [Yoonia sp. F2084L]MCK0096935.1 AraC family transcriptional regulator [Yoonia sp. F2084L]
MSLTDKLIWQMEMHLHQTVTLEALADACAVSPYHMARSFRQATGLSPMTYLRARRLSVAAVNLATGNRDILTIALDAQYNSHAAFTRAFASYFRVPPNSVRKARSLQNLNLMEPLKMEQELIVDVPAPEMKKRDAFRVIGLSTKCSFGNNSAIPPLWEAFNGRIDELDADTDGPFYGVCCDVTPNEDFRYVAGVEGNASSKIPKGMDDVTIPAGKYAVFTHKGHIADFPKTVYTVWNKALPDAGLTPREAPEFELYDQRFDIATGRGVVELWIPVA